MLLKIDMALFVLWVVIGAFLYGAMAWHKAKTIRRAKAAGRELSEEERKDLEKMLKLRPGALFGCAMMATAMFLMMLSQWI